MHFLDYWQGRSFQRNEPGGHILLYICNEELAHAIRKTEKSHDLPSVNWRLRKAKGVIPFVPEGLRTRGVDGVNPILMAGEDEMKSPS